MSGAGKPTSIIRLAEALGRLYGKNIEPYVSYRYRRLLGYEPSVRMEEGLKNLVKWAVEHGWTAVDFSDKAIRELERESSSENFAMFSNKPLVSVIIPTLNCARILRECLDSIRNQTYKNIEIIVVDDHSSDGTPNIAREYGAKVFTYGPGQNAPFAKVFGTPIQQNYGASLCKGDYIYLVDSDMRLHPRIIEKCIAKVQEGADAVIVPEISIGESFWAKCKMLEKLGYYGDLLESPRFIKKSVWANIGGLDAKVGGFYDWDLTDRIKAKGYRLARIDIAVIHYEGDLSLRRLIRKKYIYGKYMREYMNKSKSRVRFNSITMITRFTPYRLFHYLKSDETMFRKPTLILGLLFMKIFEFAAMFLGFIASKVETA